MYYEFKCNREEKYFSLEKRVVDGEMLNRLAEAATSIVVDNEKNKSMLEEYGLSLNKLSDRGFYSIKNDEALRKLLGNIKLSFRRSFGVSRLFIEPDCKKKEFGQIHIYDAGILFDAFPDAITDLIDNEKINLKLDDEFVENKIYNNKSAFDLELEGIEEAKDFPFDRPLNDKNCYSGEEALYLSLKKAISLGSEEARYRLAEKYLKGDGLHKSINKAICLLTEGALLNQLPSIELLVDLYTDDCYTVPNYELANVYAKLGAAKGSYLCTKKLVYNYLYGKGCRRNLNASIFYARIGMDLKEDKGLFEWVIANIYLKYEELNKSKEEAIKLLKIASDKGLKNATVKLSLIYKDDEELFLRYGSKSLKQNYYIREDYWRF